MRSISSLWKPCLIVLGTLASGCGSPGKSRVPTADTKLSTLTSEPTELRDMRVPEEAHLANVRQLTFGGENAEAYWSFAGDQLSFQTTRAPYTCDQIMRMPARFGASPSLVSTGKGRTTCAHFMKGDAQIVYSSTHEAGPACPPPPDMSKGYVWAIYPEFEIYRANVDGSNVVRMTTQPGYDAEATVCGKDGSIIFTSTRDGDLELYRMDADGANVVRLTYTPGYDGGAFFSADCSKIVWRASRPTGAKLDEYRALLAQNLVRPTQLELFVANADGSEARQITYLGAGTFAPFFHPSGKKILFSTNYPNPRGREFDIWSIGVDGLGLERITYAEGFDGFPMFSPDGRFLVFSSNRRDTEPGPDGKPVYRVTKGPVGETDTNVFLAEWHDAGLGTPPPQAASHDPVAERFAARVAYLADDARGGRGVGSEGLADATAWVVKALEAAGVAPAGAGKPGELAAWLQPFAVVMRMTREANESLRVAGEPVPATAFTPYEFSATGKAGKVEGQVLRVGWGMVEGKRDDYRGKPVRGKIVVVHRGSDRPGARGDFAREKAFWAKARGAKAVIVVDDGKPEAPEAPLPSLEGGGREGDAGVPVLAVTRQGAARLVDGASVAIAVRLTPVRANTSNIVGVIRAGAARKLPGAIVIGAHLDHLGLGGPGANSLDKPGVIHNGADDNASGVAALLEIAGTLAGKRTELARDVYIVAFSAEELGVLGSAHFVKHVPGKSKLMAMLNLDMVGRMRNNTVAVLGGDSAAEWAQLVTPLCEAARLQCTVSGSGYGPSDHMPFYIAKVPVLHFFTGAHFDYHRGSDDANTLNVVGGARIAELVAGLGSRLAATPALLTYKASAAPPPSGARRMAGTTLGTIPVYSDDANQAPGAAISGVVPDGPAAKAGLVAGDRIVSVGANAVANVRDLMFVLQAAQPGETAALVFVRDGKRHRVAITFAQRP